MCSFILAFLILIVIFDLINDSVPEWHIAPTSAQTKSDCPANVVFTLQGFHSFDTDCFAETAAHTCSTPFKGQTFDQSHPKAHHYDGRIMAVEMQSLPENQQENGTKMCHMPRSLEQWHKTQYRAETKNSGRRRSWMGRMAPILGRVTALMALGQSTIEVPLQVEFSQQSQCQIECTSYQGKTWQRQREGEKMQRLAKRAKDKVPMSP